MSRQEAGSIGVDQRHRRVEIGSPSPESFKGKLDPRVVRFLVGASLVALGAISLARPTIDSAARIDVLTHPSTAQVVDAVGDTPNSSLVGGIGEDSDKSSVLCSFGISEIKKMRGGSMAITGTGNPGTELDVRLWPRGVLWVQAESEVAAPQIDKEGNWKAIVKPSDQKLKWNVAVGDDSCSLTKQVSP